MEVHNALSALIIENASVELGNKGRNSKEVIELLNQWGGLLEEIPYSREISDISLKNQLLKLGLTGHTRQTRLRQLLKLKPVVRIMEVHNALSALIIENASVELGNKKG